MAQIIINEQTLDVLIKIATLAVLILLGVLLYRLNRIAESSEHSIELVEKTAENVESSTETVSDLVSIARKIPLVGGKRDE